MIQRQDSDQPTTQATARLPESNDLAVDTLRPTPVRMMRIETVAILVIMFVGGALRFANLGQSPPGLNQDEAINSWNAYCLLRTGRDQNGKAWPVFYSRAIGENRTTLGYYLVLPAQALGGLNVFTTRVPAAIAGWACIPLLYFVGNRLFGSPVGLVAAGVLAVSSWHLQLSRWGHEANFGPALGLIPLAAWLWAGLPVVPESRSSERGLWRLAFAGIVTGLVCYGYPAVRLFVPAFLFLALLGTWRPWKEDLATRSGLQRIAVFAVMFGVAFGPLVWCHFFDPNIGKRGEMTSLWEPTDPILTRLGRMAQRYSSHYSMDWLYLRGDHFDLQAPVFGGTFPWWILPLHIVGALTCLRLAWKSPPYRLLAIWVLAYPLGDIFARHVSMHALRSAPGMCSLVLLAAVGITRLWKWSSLWTPKARWTLGSIGILWMLGTTAVQFDGFFGEYNWRPRIYHLFHCDLVEACQWLKPRIDNVDAVFVTVRGMNQPFAVMGVALGSDPVQWFRDGCDVDTRGTWDIYHRCGKLHFMYGAPAHESLETLRTNDRPDRVIFIVRPGEVELAHPAISIQNPDGVETLWISEVTL
jgi:hypothetical protein